MSDKKYECLLENDILSVLSDICPKDMNFFSRPASLRAKQQNDKETDMMKLHSIAGPYVPRSFHNGGRKLKISSLFMIHPIKRQHFMNS